MGDELHEGVSSSLSQDSNLEPRRAVAAGSPAWTRDDRTAKTIDRLADG